jgi:NhaA family Na+:H+ antiporter
MAGKFSNLFADFFKSGKVAGLLLVLCTIISLILANSAAGPSYLHLLHSKLDLSFSFVNLNYSVEHWVNDGLMAVFFLLVGLEIERELYVGELSSFKNAILPVLAAVGGMVLPAGIHLFFNAGTETQAGFGIPMATDIAFALGVLSLAGNRVPVSLKIFLTALAIIDDLGAITVIAIFYTDDFSLTYFGIAIAIFVALFVLGRLKVCNLAVYLVAGIVMWYCMLKSGVHATIAGVLLAFAIPFHKVDEMNPSYKLQHFLHNPVAYIILPIFALANTAILLPADMISGLTTNNSIGIMAGLLVGKLVGILSICWLAVKAGIARLPDQVNWLMLSGLAVLAGIGFTMSIFITNLAFTDARHITDSKISILLSSVLAALIGILMLKSAQKKNEIA